MTLPADIAQIVQRSYLLPPDEQVALAQALMDLDAAEQVSASVDSLAAFVRYMWPEIEPGTELVHNWHIGAICAELESVTRGEVRELVICVPPGTLKSVIVSVMWPCWQWLARPHLRGLHISNSERLCVRDSRRARDIITSDRYGRCVTESHERHGTPMWSISDDQAEKVHFANTEHGVRLAVPSHARITGDRGSCLVIDDPLDASESVIGTPEQVRDRMEEIQHRYDHVWASRLNDPQNDPRVVIMQRLAMGDLAGVLIERGVRHVVLPMEFDPDHPHRYPLDPRTERGELLFPSRFGGAWVDDQKSTPGAARHWQAQYQQLPQPIGGNVFNPSWFRYWRPGPDNCYRLASDDGGRLVSPSDCWRVIVGDTALTTQASSDFTVLQVWDVLKESRDMVLVDQWRDQADAPTVEAAITRLVARWKPVGVALEDTTASKAIIQRLQRDGLLIRGLKPKDYGGDKVNRAYGASILVEQGHVWFPHGASWLPELEAELTGFPGGTHDDQCDTLVYAILHTAERDQWVEPKPKPFARGTLGHILNHDKILHPAPKSSVFSLDRRR